MALEDLLLRLARQIGSSEPEAVLEKSIGDVLANNGLNGGPGWFAQLLQTIVAGEVSERIHFASDAMSNDQWDVANALAELAEVLPLGYEDYGEGISLVFPQQGKRAFISREGAGGSYFFEVRAF